MPQPCQNVNWQKFIQDMLIYNILLKKMHIYRHIRLCPKQWSILSTMCESVSIAVYDFHTPVLCSIQLRLTLVRGGQLHALFTRLVD